MPTPLKYNPAYHDDWAWSLAIKGATDQDIADAFHVSRRTIIRWRQTYPSFNTACQSGKEVADAKVKKSLFERAVGFEYQEKEGLYHRFQYGGQHKGNEGLIAVKNIIFQYVEWGHYATTDYLNINVHKGHEGYYFTNGKVQKITWKKDGEFGVTRYYDMDGNEITLNKGKTWICIIGTDRYNKAEIYGK